VSAAVSYPLHQTTLDNGLKVLVSPDSTVPVVALNIWYDVGSRDEVPGRTGLAHLFEHLMFEGSANVGAGEHLAAVQAVGGSANATTWFDRTNYFETVPTGALDLALWLETDRLASLDLTQHNLDNQRDVVMEEKRQRYDNVPYGDVLVHLVELTYPPDHPYGHPTIGSMDDLASAGLEDVRQFFASHYSPNNAVITLVGDIHPDDAVARVQASLGALPASEVRHRPTAAPLGGLTGIPRRNAVADVPTEALYATWRLPARNTRAFDAVELAFAILGDGQTSRLHRRLVRTDLIAEGAGSSALGLIGGTSVGFAQARALDGVRAEALEEAILDELDRLLADGPTAAEVDRAKAQYEREWLSELARFDSRADLFSGYATLHDDPDEVNRRLDDVRSVTADEITQAAREHLQPDSRAVLSYRKSRS
jgi:zinc protease